MNKLLAALLASAAILSIGTSVLAADQAKDTQRRDNQPQAHHILVGTAREHALFEAPVQPSLRRAFSLQKTDQLSGPVPMTIAVEVGPLARQ